jgi:hypothetical protein
MKKNIKKKRKKIEKKGMKGMYLTRLLLRDGKRICCLSNICPRCSPLSSADIYPRRLRDRHARMGFVRPEGLQTTQEQITNDDPT